jgi:hypothetical protein
MTVETERLVEASLRVGDDEQLDAITFSHGLGRQRTSPAPRNSGSLNQAGATRIAFKVSVPRHKITVD